MNNYKPYFDVAGLVAKYLRKELTEQEKDELDRWLESSADNQKLFQKLTDGEIIQQELETFSSTEEEKAWKNIVKKTGFKKDTSRTFSRKNLYPYTAAAILLLVSSLSLLHFFAKKPPVNALAQHQEDILPGSNKAVLTLADGSKILLDDAKRGKIASQKNVEINKTQNGQLIYKVGASLPRADNGASGNIIPINTITTPRGGQYTVVLPDGTKIWLNAASSLKYPTEFSGTERRVELSGEAYFEVAKNAAKPFFVKTASQTVKVLGTHFNINSYTDEKVTRTTLLEGSVHVTGNFNLLTVKLKPGQQAISNANKVKMASDPNLDEVMAWKNGKFLFNDTELKTIMRQLSRWYDVDIEYQGEIAEKHYQGRVSRDVPVSQIFQILKTSGINFTIIGRKIIVKS